MNIFKISSYFLLIIALHSMKAMEHKQDELLKKVVIGTYLSTIITELALLTLPSFQSLFFGNGPVDEATKNDIHSLATSLTLKSIPTIQQGYPLWHRFLGSTFSNHTTLFIDPTQYSLSNDTINTVKKNLIDIKYNRDTNILIAAILIPVIIYGTLKTTSLLLKNVTSMENSIFGKVKRGIDFLSQNFTATSLITLGTVLGFIKAQDYYLANR